MARFIETGSGEYINLDCVVWSRNNVNKDGESVTCFYGDKGKLLFETIGDFDLEEMTAPIIPASQSITAFLVCVACKPEDQRPTENNVVVRPALVIGWRHFAGDRWEPVFSQPPLEGEDYLIEMPNGQLCGSWYDIFDNLEDGKAALLSFSQWNWDQKNGKELEREECSELNPVPNNDEKE